MATTIETPTATNEAPATTVPQFLEVKNKFGGKEKVFPSLIPLNLPHDIELLYWLSYAIEGEPSRLPYINIGPEWVSATDGRRMHQVRRDTFQVPLDTFEGHECGGNAVMTERKKNSVVLMPAERAAAPTYEQVIPKTGLKRTIEPTLSYPSTLAKIIRAMPKDEAINPNFVLDALGRFTEWREADQLFKRVKLFGEGSPVMFDGENRRAIIMPIRIH
jgi:hypothetical protein